MASSSIYKMTTFQIQTREMSTPPKKASLLFPVPNVNRNETVILVLNYEKSGIRSVESWFNKPLYNKVFKVKQNDIPHPSNSKISYGKVLDMTKHHCSEFILIFVSPLAHVILTFHWIWRHSFNWWTFSSGNIADIPNECPPTSKR